MTAGGVQLAIFLLRLLQPLGLIHLQAAVFLAPAVVGLLGDPDNVAYFFAHI